MKASPLRPLGERLQRLVGRVGKRPDTEFQQAVIRVVIGLAFLAYFSSDLAALDASTRTTVQWVSVAFGALALLIAAAALLSLSVSPARRIGAMVLDYATCSFLLAYTGEGGSPLLAVYLWVTLGNGFRYGTAYLYTATTMAITGFLLVLAYSPYWSEHTWIGVAFLLSMIAVPLYTASLLKQMHGAIERERKANQAKSSFLANMSHELRTPLNGVIGVADILTGTRLDKEQRELAHIIRASANTLLELIDNVLDISRIEAGRVNRTAEDFDLHRLVNGTVAVLDPQARRKNLSLTAHIAPQTPYALHGDARHLRQVLINLIGNAIKFTEQGRVDVYVTPVGGAQAQRLRFEIVDTGIGIPDAAQPHIFESFTQADPSVTRRFGGSGLGTTIAKQLVESLGGCIDLSSRVGEGTTFWFELPFDVRSEGGPAIGLESPGRIAVLADRPLADRLRTLIGSWGAETMLGQDPRHFESELAALAGSGRALSAVVIARAAVPGDPAVFLHRLQDSDLLPDVPVILIEPEAETPALRDAQLLREGYASVLGTPVNPTLLFNAIHAALSREMPPNVVSLADRFTMPGTGLRILVAEDNPINCRVVRGLLEQAGHETVLARHGEEALAMLESADPPFDVAIIDMHMPEVSGPDVVQRWRFMESGHLPVVMLTADARPEAKAAAEAAGADLFLTKPVNSRELTEAISRLAGRPKKAPASAGAEAVLDEAVLDELGEMGGNGFVRELIESFDDESERLLHDIEGALDGQAYGLWHDKLHMLKGGASDIGARELARRCAEAERIKAFEIAVPLARMRFESVREALAAARQALAAYQATKLRAERR